MINGAKKISSDNGFLLKFTKKFTKNSLQYIKCLKGRTA